MQNYIFLSALLCILLAMPRNRVPALLMAISYLIYIFGVNKVESNVLYYLLVTVQEFVIGFTITMHYLKTGYMNSLYIAYCSFLGVFVHIYGRIVYGADADPFIYIGLCLLVVICQLMLMLTGRIEDGFIKHIERMFAVFVNRFASQKSIFKMQTIHAEKASCQK